MSATFFNIRVKKGQKWARLGSNQRPSGYASHYSFRCPFRVCGLDYPFAPKGRLPSSLYTFLQKEAWLGITLSYDIGLPRIWQVITDQLPDRQPFSIKSYQGYNPVMTNISNCIICGKPLQGRQTKFCSVTCKNKDLQSYHAQQRRGLARKLNLIRDAGGHCSICGYHKNLAALVFHHTDSSEKDFKLDMRSLSNRKFEPIQEEISKCILVCANCHAELHNPSLDLDLLL